MKYQFTPPSEKLKAFTLAEVLITLVIIGVIAAITVPSLLQSSQDKEFHSMYRKNLSALQNALQRAQVEEGLIGDNAAVFTPSEDSNRSYESAKRLAAYMNTIKVCENLYDTDIACEGLYYPIKYLQSYEGDDYDPSYRTRMLLSDGSIYDIYTTTACENKALTCETDAYGNCLRDESGNVIMTTFNKKYCALVIIDVNGAKGPNKFGKDNFMLLVYKDKIVSDDWYPRGGSVQSNIILNKI